jgi:NDP-sugar pyrophosphorylase family protein
MKAMIFAAGRGSRLRPLTDTLPKALVEVAGQTLLEHVVLRLIGAGVTEVVINLHHLGEQIPPFVERHSGFGLRRVAYSDEPVLLGTGGGLKKAAWFFDDDEPFLVHNADVLSTVDLGGLLLAHRRTQALATLAVMARPTKRPLHFDSAGRLVGRRTSEGRDEQVREPEGNVVPLGFCGIQAVSPNLFERLSESGTFGIAEAYLRLSGAGETILGQRVEGAKWRDCGRPEDLHAL